MKYLLFFWIIHMLLFPVMSLSQDSKNSKDSKDGKDSKNSKDSKDGKDDKNGKDSKDSKNGKDSKDEGFKKKEALKVKEKGIEMGIYGFTGYFQAIQGNGSEYYGGLGLVFYLSDEWRAHMGGFFDFVDGSIIIDNEKTEEYFVGLEFGLFYSPWGLGFLMPYVGVREAIAFYRSLYIRSSLVLGLALVDLELLKLWVDYSVGYVAGSVLEDNFFSHLIGLNFAIQL